jgi:hypothetical protein
MHPFVKSYSPSIFQQHQMTRKPRQQYHASAEDLVTCVTGVYKLASKIFFVKRYESRSMKAGSAQARKDSEEAQRQKQVSWIGLSSIG